FLDRRPENLKMGDFSLHSRKISAYLPRNEHHSAFNRKISGYFIFAGYSIKDKDILFKRE
ncbi:hypothetical protein, partial [Neobacillus vireti]|uniref:hypothetical protein n=1 Tax=Neobacillus vireti TaxID=220686 RepID=UPI0030006B25